MRVLTINDWIEVRRTSWWKLEGGLDMSKTDGLLGITQQVISIGASELLCRLNMSSSSFDRTAENLWSASRIRLSAESLRKIVESEGKLMAEALSEGAGSPPWEAGDCKSPQGTTRVYMGCDGVKVPVVRQEEKAKRRAGARAKRRKIAAAGKDKLKPLPPVKKGADDSYKEMRIVTVYDEKQKHRHVAVTLGNHVRAGRIMKRLARWLKLAEALELGALIDGAVWIRNQVEAMKLPLLRLLLDFWHLSEHVHEAARTVFGEGDTARAWALGLLHTVKHNGYDAMWTRLVEWRAGVSGESRTKAVDALMHYVSERKAMLHYDWALAHGWQIGSGPTEAQCKTTTRRIKGSGMRWDFKNVEAIMAIEAMKQSHQWDAYWNSRQKLIG